MCVLSRLRDGMHDRSSTDCITLRLTVERETMESCPVVHRRSGRWRAIVNTLYSNAASLRSNAVPNSLARLSWEGADNEAARQTDTTENDLSSELNVTASLCSDRRTGGD